MADGWEILFGLIVGSAATYYIEKKLGSREIKGISNGRKISLSQCPKCECPPIRIG